VLSVKSRKLYVWVGQILGLYLITGGKAKILTSFFHARYQVLVSGKTKHWLKTNLETLLAYVILRQGTMVFCVQHAYQGTNVVTLSLVISVFKLNLNLQLVPSLS
jgi:hypothetical protein